MGASPAFTASFVKKSLETFLGVQWLRLCAPDAGGMGSVPGQRTRSHMLQLKIPYATTKTWHSQINKFFFHFIEISAFKWMATPPSHSPFTTEKLLLCQLQSGIPFPGPRYQCRDGMLSMDQCCSMRGRQRFLELLGKKHLHSSATSALCFEAEAMQKVKQMAWKKLSLRPIPEPLSHTNRKFTLTGFSNKSAHSVMS